MSWLAIVYAITTIGDCALAQITPDGTLGAESSVVTPLDPDFPVDQIDGGAIRGANLFHSFREFNIDEGRGAYFTNPAGIENILSRVTGGNPSNILGTLGVLGNANLFLISPNGIIFGPNARLDVGGSFVGTTANAIGLASGDIFSGNPGEPLPSQLLNVNPNAFLFNQIPAQPIINRSRAAGIGLKVPPGMGLLLVGGDVRLEGGQLQALGGNVELGGLAASGSIGLSMNGSQGSLSFPDGVARADVYLTNIAGVNVAASNGGSIAITARNIDIARSVLFGGLGKDLGFPGAQAGDIELRAQGRLNVANSLIFNILGTGAVGTGGNIDITAGSLSVTNGAELSTSTFGQGDAGSVNINAHDAVSFDKGDAFSKVLSGAVGNGGDIKIKAGSLLMTNGAQLQSLTEGQGKAGSVNINVRDRVSFDVSSTAASTVEHGAVGEGGNIDITAGSLSVTNGAQLQTLVRGTSETLPGGRGNAGNVKINARDRVSFSGVGSNGLPSAAFSSLGSGAVGKGGDIDITTGLLSVTDNALLVTSSVGQGDAGNVNIDARDSVSFDGVGSNGVPSSVSSSLGSGAVGKGGNINIKAGSLSMTNGAFLNANTFGQGDAGSVTIESRDSASFDGVGSNGLPSAAFSTVERGAVGEGGNIDITAGSLSVTNGAQLQTLVRGASETLPGGRGNSGNVKINARNRISFDGVGSNGLPSAAISTVGAGAMGTGGNIDITTGSLSVTNSALLSASSQGSNNTAGNIVVGAGSIRLDNQAALIAETQGGQGNIFLGSQDLVLSRESNITTDAQGTATGGNINIDTDILVALEDSDISANAVGNFGGQVIIDAQGIFGTKFQEEETPESDITATSELGPEFSGTVEINTPDVDPSSGLVNLPAVPVDTEVSQGCTKGRSLARSEFIITGRGGLPPNPGDALNTDAVQVDLITLDRERSGSQASGVEEAGEEITSEIVEATGWVKDANGNVVLIANASTLTPHSSWQKTTDCRAFNQQLPAFFSN